MSPPIRSSRGLRSVEASATRRAVGVERHGAVRLSIPAELYLLDAGLRRLEPRLALLLQAVAFAVKLDGLVERSFAALELANDLFEPLQGRFERKPADLFPLV